MAATQHGLDGEGTDGLVGYCLLLAREQPKAFAQLLGRIIPTQLTDTGERPIIVELVRFGDPPKDGSHGYQSNAHAQETT